MRSFRDVTDQEVLDAVLSVPTHFVVGPTYGGDGTTPPTLRYGKSAEQVVVSAHGKYYEAASRGALFSACEQAAGVAVVATVSTTSILSLYNPVGSGKRLALKRVSCFYFSGTYGNAGSVLYHCMNATPSQTAPSSGTLLTANCLDIGNNSAPVGVARTASTVVAPVALYPIIFIPINYISTATTTPLNEDQDVDGMFVVEPGCSYQIQSLGTASGATSPKVSVAVVWEEIPVV